MINFKVVKDPHEAFNSTSHYAALAKGAMDRLLAGTELSGTDRSNIEFLIRLSFECGYMMGTEDGIAEGRAAIE